MSNGKFRKILTGGDTLGRATTLGLQHVFAMFGSTVLVPALTGLDASVTLLSMGIGTLIFHLCTKGVVPAFMGSSFSFITAICAVMTKCGGNAAYVGWGIMASGLLYLLLAGLVKIFGAKKVTNFFPPVVTGCMIIIIGMMLAPTAMNNVTGVPGDFAEHASITLSEDAEQKEGYIRYEAGVVKGWLNMEDLNKDGIAYSVKNEEGTALLKDAKADAKAVKTELNLAKGASVIIKEDAEEKDGYIYYEDLGKEADETDDVKGWIKADDLKKTGTAYSVIERTGTTLYEEANAEAKTVKSTMTWKYWVVAVFTIIVIILVMFFVRGFFKLIPILIGIVAGYCLSAALGLVDFTSVANARWFTTPNVSFFITKGLDWGKIGFAITMIAPISIVTFVEHVGDITANGAVTGHNYIEEPGLNRTLLGCGLASIFSGGLGGPAATTYSENTGVLAATKNYNPATLRIAALFAILLAFIGKVAGVLQSIPAPVMGGVSVILFGMISSVGLRMLVENNVDFTRSYNLIIAGIMLVFGLGLANGITIGSVTISGTAIAAVLGIILAKVLPKKDADERKEEKEALAKKK